jgi:hypothetical protein
MHPRAARVWSAHGCFIDLVRPWCSDCDAPVEEARVVRAARHGSVLIEARCHGKTRTAEMPVRALQARPPRPVQEAAAPC